LAGPVDFFNGLVTIDNKGNLVAQSVSAKEVVTNKLTISNTPIATSSGINTPGVGFDSPGVNASIGSGKIPTGQTKTPRAKKEQSLSAGSRSVFINTQKQ